MHRTPRLLALLALILALVGCSVGSGSQGQVVAQGAAAPAQDSGALPSGPQATAVPRSPTEPGQGPATERQVTRTGALTIRTGDVQQAAARLREIAQANQGIVVDEQLHVGDSSGTTRVVLSVPSASLTRVMDEAATVGEVVDRSVTATDVTDRVVDVDARIRTLRASIERIRALMQRAGSIKEIASVEGELTDRQGELESLLATQAALKNQVERAPITVTLVRPDQLAIPANPLVVGLIQGWEALQKSISVLLTVVGGVLPFALVGALIAWPLVHRRRTRGRRGDENVSPPPDRHASQD